MFIQNIDPNLITIFGLHIRFYGMVYAFGFLFVTWYLEKKAREGKIKNLTVDRANTITTLAIIFGIIGARIFHVISDFQLYKDNPIGVLYIWNGGLGFQGGFFLALLAIYIYCRKHKIDLIRLLDSVSLPMPVIIGFGRIANYINSEHIGYVTNVPWCVVFVRSDLAGCRHPAQLYQAISQFLLFFIMLWLSRSKLGKKKGVLTWTFFIGYGAFRFITDFFRSDYHTFIFGLTHTQIINLIILAIGLYNMYRIIKVKR